MNWRELRACKDKDVSFFFPTNKGGAKKAMKVCETCPVKLACLEFAIVNQIMDGIWGGTTETVRERLIKERFGNRNPVEFNYLAVQS